jgi:hypothetical protein
VPCRARAGPRGARRSPPRCSTVRGEGAHCEGPGGGRPLGARPSLQPALHLSVASTSGGLCGARGPGVDRALRLDRCPVPEHSLVVRPAAPTDMKREDLRRLFTRARDLCGHTDYVVLGSLAVLGHTGSVPRRMTASLDVDAYTRRDPGRIFDLAAELGQGAVPSRPSTATTSIRSPPRWPRFPTAGNRLDPNRAAGRSHLLVPRAERRRGGEVRGRGWTLRTPNGRPGKR